MSENLSAVVAGAKMALSEKVQETALGSAVLVSLRDRILVLQKETENAFLEQGQLLLQAKKAVGEHGGWLKWLKSVNISAYKAQRLMKIARVFEHVTPEFYLSYSHAYALTMLPEEKLPDFLRVAHDVGQDKHKMVSDMSKRELEKAIANFLRPQGNLEAKSEHSKGINTQPSSEDSFESSMQSVNDKIDLLLSMVQNVEDSDTRQLQVMEFQSLCKKIYEAFPEASPDA